MLKGVTKGGKKKPPRIVLYGEKKIGKSTFAADGPDPIFVTTEDGVDNISVDQYPVPESWKEFVCNVQDVANATHQYRTLVVDTLGGAVDLAAAHVCATQFKGAWGEKGFMGFARGWASTSEEMRPLLPLLDKCRARGMTVLLLAHTGIVSVKNPVDGDYTKFQPDLDKRVWSRFAAWADVIVRADYEHCVVEIDGKKKAVGSTTRVLRTSGGIAEDAGCRVGYALPEELPLSWSAFAAALGRDNGTADEARRLIALFGADEERRALDYLRVTAVEEIEKAPEQKVNQLINALRRKEQANAPSR